MPEPEVTDTSLRVSRVIQAPREEVYQALTDPSSRHAKAFVPNQAPGQPMDLVFDREEPAREGGPYRVTMSADQGPAEGQHTAYGEFLELIPTERIIETHNWAGEPDHPETRVTITLEDVAGVTRVTILHEGLAGCPTRGIKARAWPLAWSGARVGTRREASNPALEGSTVPASTR